MTVLEEYIFPSRSVQKNAQPPGPQIAIGKGSWSRLADCPFFPKITQMLAADPFIRKPSFLCRIRREEKAVSSRDDAQISGARGFSPPSGYE